MHLSQQKSTPIQKYTCGKVSASVLSPSPGGRGIQFAFSCFSNWLSMFSASRSCARDRPSSVTCSACEATPCSAEAQISSDVVNVISIFVQMNKIPSSKLVFSLIFNMLGEWPFRFKSRKLFVKVSGQGGLHRAKPLIEGAQEPCFMWTSEAPSS